MANEKPTPLPHTRKVSRLPPLPEKVDPIMEERFAQQRARGAEPINLHLAQGHAPILSKAKGEFTWKLRNETKLGRKLLELRHRPRRLDHGLRLRIAPSPADDRAGRLFGGADRRGSR